MLLLDRRDGMLKKRSRFMQMQLRFAASDYGRFCRIFVCSEAPRPFT